MENALELVADTLRLLLRNAEDLKHLAMVGGIIVGGWWTYRAFVRERIGYPKIELDLDHEIVELDDAFLVHAQIRISNVGSVVFRGSKARAESSLVVPESAEFRDIWQGGLKDPVAPDKHEFGWEVLTNREWSGGTPQFEVEPREFDLICADFFVAKEVRLVRLYFHLASPSGWWTRLWMRLRGWWTRLWMRFGGSEASSPEPSQGLGWTITRHIPIEPTLLKEKTMGKGDEERKQNEERKQPDKDRKEGSQGKHEKKEE